MATNTLNTGPLTGLKVIEFAGIGPGPFAAMMLSHMGADVLRITRQDAEPIDPNDFPLHGRRSLAMNLKAPGAADIILRLVERSDALLEGFRPGVMERLGLGPDDCRAHNPKLVYGRITGWGQTGTLSHSAGHDLNYIAITGALWSTGHADRAPTFASNLLGDYGGGAMPLALGMLAGLLQAQRTGFGTVVDAAICDGTSALMTHMHSRRAMGVWHDEREANQLDGGAPWYSVYECSDGQWISIAALEHKFWNCLVDLLGFTPDDFGDRSNEDTWQETRAKLKSHFLSKPRDHWTSILEGTDACYAPVLSPAEVQAHPHMRARNAFFTGDHTHPKPTPKFDTQIESSAPPAQDLSTNVANLLKEAGFADEEIDALQASEIFSTPTA
ncbi:MAG: CoA transferase [Granulosicoccus sp.]|nr:CoA transferase [Granulosicoccus sp.]